MNESNLTRILNSMMPLAVNMLGFIAFGSIGFWLGMSANLNEAAMFTFATGLVVWIMIYIATGLTMVKQNDFLVIERFGLYYRTAREGLTVLCLKGLIDRPVWRNQRGDYKYHQGDFYTGQSRNEKNFIDFTDGSAPIVGKYWWRVIRGVITFTKNGQEFVEEAEKLWTYSVADTVERINQLISASLRPILQQYSVDEACRNLENITQEIVREVQESLKEMGVELDTTRGIVLEDIALPPEVIAARQEVLMGKKQAERQAAQSKGYAEAIKKIQEDLGVDMSTAIRIYENQRSLETLEKKPGSINFVSPSMGGVITAFQIPRDENKGENH